MTERREMRKTVLKAHLIVWGRNLAYLILSGTAKTNVPNWG
jgi:hypothetical protein